MSGSEHFQVTTATLRAVAGQFGGEADQAGQIADRAKEADVATESWGLLGLSLGLYAGYSSARTAADTSIGKVKTFLLDAQTALQSTARDYDETDRAGGQLFEALHKGLA
jgi:hypothetical protein